MKLSMTSQVSLTAHYFVNCYPPAVGSIITQDDLSLDRLIGTLNTTYTLPLPQDLAPHCRNQSTDILGT